MSLFGLWENWTKGWVWPWALEWSTGSLIFLFPDSLGVGSRAVVGRDPVLMILHMKILQGGAEEGPKEKKKERTAQTAGWDGKGANGRDNGDGLLLVNVLMLWDDVPCERDCVVGKAVLRSSSSCVCSVSPALCVLPVLLLQEWREKVPCGNRQLLHVGSSSVSPMYDGNIRWGCGIWGCCWRVLLSHCCYKERAAGQEGTLNCLIWPPAPRLGQIYPNFPSRCLSKAVVKSLQWWTFLIVPGWS